MKQLFLHLGIVLYLVKQPLPQNLVNLHSLDRRVAQLQAFGNVAQDPKVPLGTVVVSFHVAVQITLGTSCGILAAGTQARPRQA